MGRLGERDLLSFLVRNLTATKVLLIGTYRTEELGRDHELRPWMRELGRHGRVTNLRLDGLDRDEMAEMIGGIWSPAGLGIGRRGWARRKAMPSSPRSSRRPATVRLCG